MKRTYIITGAKGHLASTIIRYLRGRNCHIRGIILPTEEGEDDSQVTYYKADVSKLDSLTPAFSDLECNEVVVIHTAGIISIEDEVTPRLYEVNVQGTRNIVAQCQRIHVKRLVYVSSVHAIPEKSDEPISEVDSFSKEKVIGGYAETKAEATQFVLDAVREGLDAVVVHPSGIIGPYDKGGNHLVQMIGMYVSGKLPAGVIGGYDFVDVRDVAKGCIEAVDRGHKGSCYILSNSYYSIKEILEFARKAVNGKKKLFLPLGLARAFAPFFEWIAHISHTRPLYTKYALHVLGSRTHFSHERATRELGYRPRDMRKTIVDTIHFLKGQKVPLEA